MVHLGFGVIWLGNVTGQDHRAKYRPINLHSSNILGIALKRYYVPKILIFCNAAWQDCWNHCTMYHQLHCLDIWPTSDNSVCHQTSMFVLGLMLAVCVWIRPDSERWSLHVKHNPSLEGPRRAWAYFKDTERTAGVWGADTWNPADFRVFQYNINTLMV